MEAEFLCVKKFVKHHEFYHEDLEKYEDMITLNLPAG
jgi:hypothetical protein